MTVKRKHPEAICEECPLAKAPCAVSGGPSTAKFAVISRSPGAHDTYANRPFSGPSGKLLDHLLKQNGVERDEVFVTNMVLCQCDEVPDEAMESCRPRLEAELRECEADTYIVAGTEAVTYFTGEEKLRASRGRVLRPDNSLIERCGFTDDTRIVATYNPAAALRDDRVFPDLVSDFSRAIRPRTPAPIPTVEIVYGEEQALSHIASFRRAAPLSPFAIDIESTGLSSYASILSISVSRSASESVVFTRRALEFSSVREELSAFLVSDFTFIYHNGQFDVRLLRRNGFAGRIDEDTMLLSYSTDERSGVHSLEYLTQNELGWPDYEPESVSAGKVNSFSEEPIYKVEYRYYKTGIGNRFVASMVYPGFTDWEGLYEYNGYDTAGSFALWELLTERMRSLAHNTEEAYRRLLIPAANTFVEIEDYGLPYSKPAARRMLKEEVMPELETEQAHCNMIVGEAINLNSHVQVSKWIYDEKGVRNPLFRPGKERSVDAHVRKALMDAGIAWESLPKDVQQFISHLDRFKKLDKLRGTYLTGMLPRVDPDGRIRTSLLLHGTETGRLSSRSPNLQNIPREGKENMPDIRALFIAPEGRCFVQADYSQAELRCAAVISGDEALLDIYRRGSDLHDEVATDFYGHGYTKEHRVRAKGVNFGILYGIGGFKLSQMLNFSQSEAEALISAWWRKFPRVKEWVESTRVEAQQNGFLFSAFGRRRRFHLITRDNLDHTLKEAVNFKIQSPASDLTLLSGIDLQRTFSTLDRSFNASVCLLVHDSILVECDVQCAREVAARMVGAMEAIPIRELHWEQIPFKADVTYGKTWSAQSAFDHDHNIKELVA